MSSSLSDKLGICAALLTAYGVLASAGADAAVNPSFEEPARADAAVAGWRVRARGADVTRVVDVVGDGSHSLRVEPVDEAGELRLTQRVATAGMSGDRVRISALVRAPAAPADVALWVRVDGPDALLYVDRGGTADALEADAEAGWRRISIEAPLAARAARLTFGASVDGGARVWLDDFRVEPYSTAELPPASARALRYVERALAIMRRHALVRERVDWPALRAATLAQTRGAETRADAHLAVQFALTRLGDGHSFFMPPERVRELARAPVSNARTGRPPVAARSRPLGERLGYVRVPGFGGGAQADQVAFAEDLQNRIEALDSPPRCGWVVDLRGNSGGNLWPMLAGLGPLLGDGEVGAAVHARGAREPIAYSDGRVSLNGHVQLRVRRQPYRPARPSAPVAVLHDGRTASSAEIVAVFLRAREPARSFGIPTRGVATGTRRFPLSDGGALILTVAATSDRHGRTVEGPLEPDLRVEPAGTSAAGLDDAVIRAAVDWLASRPACAEP